MELQVPFQVNAIFRSWAHICYK